MMAFNNYDEEKLLYLTKEQEESELKKEIFQFSTVIYEDLHQKKSWSLIAKNINAFLDNGISAERIYADLRDNDKWYSIDNSLKDLLAGGLNAKNAYEDFRKANQWQIIVNNLVCFRENGIAVDMQELYDGLKSGGELTCIEDNIACFLASKISPDLIYRDLKIQDNYQCMIENLHDFLESGFSAEQLYTDLLERDDWQIIAGNAVDFMLHGIAAGRLYTDCLKANHINELAVILPALTENSLDAAEVYDQLSKLGLWTVIAQNLYALSETVTMDFRQVYLGLVSINAFRVLADNAEALIQGGILANDIYEILAENGKWQYIADNRIIFAGSELNIETVYNKLQENSLWEKIDDNIPVFLQSAIGAEKIYEQLKAEKKWWCITDNLDAFVSNGITAERVYEDLKFKGRWGEIVNSADAFVKHNITITDMEVYEYLRQEGSWGGWNKVSMFLASTIKDRKNLVEVLHKFNANGWWDEIAFSLSVFADNDVDVDIDMIYRHLKERGWWKTVIQDIEVFFKQGKYVNDIYNGLMQKGSWGRDRIVENLNGFLANGLNPALYILDAEPLQLLRSLGIILDFCDPLEVLAALKLRSDEVIEDKSFMLAIRKGFSLSEILRYPFICSILLEDHKEIK